MKKNFVFMAVAAVTILICSNIYFSKKNMKMSDLVLANIEAAAFDDEGSGGGILCSQRCSDGIGRCWIRSNSGYCVSTGYQVDFCAC